MSYEMELEREEINGKVFVLTDDDAFYWGEVFEDGKRTVQEMLIYKSEWENFKKKYS